MAKISLNKRGQAGEGFAKIWLVKRSFLYDCMGRFREDIDVYWNLYRDCHAVQKRKN